LQSTQKTSNQPVKKWLGKEKVPATGHPKELPQEMGHGASKQAVSLLGESAPTLVSPWLKRTPT